MTDEAVAALSSFQIQLKKDGFDFLLFEISRHMRQVTRENMTSQTRSFHQGALDKKIKI